MNKLLLAATLVTLASTGEFLFICYGTKFLTFVFHREKCRG